MIESAEWCQLLPEGTDTDGTEYDYCTVHGYITSAYVCEGYVALPYAGGH